ncbi:MAG: family intrarane metalloprotease [Nocardioidaceae bacterium]|nr:family intrarane metalloprotease [Nocardioidaceae bacterium]
MVRVVTMAWTWTFGFVSAGLGGGLGRALHLLALLGPVVGWVGVLTTGTGGDYRRTFLRRVVDVRVVQPTWWLAVFAVGAGLPLAAVGVAAVAGWEATVDPTPTALAVTGALGFALAAGVVEDPGWRGIALDGLTQTMGRLGTSLVLGVLWSLWHLPLYFIEGTFQHALGVATPQFWMSMTIRVPLAVLLVWLVTGTDGAIVAAVAAHALGNTVGEFLTTGVAAMGVELLITGLAATAVGTALGRPG